MSTESRYAPRWRRIAGILLTAVLLAVYARSDVAWPLGFVALVPWLRTLDADRTFRGALASGLLMSVMFVAAVFGWFGAAIGAYTGVGAAAATAVLWLLAPLLQPQVLAFGLLRHAVGRRHGPWMRAVAGASAWVGCEWLVPKLLGDTLGHGLAPAAPLRQFAELGGAASLTFLLLMVNEALALALARGRKAGLSGVLRPIAVVVVLATATAGYGFARLWALDAPAAAAAPVLRVAIVQASITDYERLREEIGAYGVVRHVLDTHYALSRAAIRDHGADVLLWSETVYPTTFGQPKSADGAALDGELLAFVQQSGVPLVFGTYDRDAAGEYNAAAFVEPGRGLLGYYRKTYPFPLTEHVPAWLDGPRLRRWLPWAGGWQPGQGARVLPLRTADGREINVVPLICLDAVHPDVAIDGARLGAQAIIALSNDSWFTAHPEGARLHLAVAAFRSIETRMPQLRVTTNGLSAIIDDTGEVVASTGMGDQAVLTGHLAAQDPPPTLMVRWGDWVGAAGLGFLLVLAARALWRWREARAGTGDMRRHTAPFMAEVAVLSPSWRAIAALLRACAGGGLLWLAADMALRRGWQVSSLEQIRIFVLAVVMPVLGAWAIARAFAATARIEAGKLVLVRRAQQVEIPVDGITRLHLWRLPLPGSGVDLELASGRRWGRGLAMDAPGALQLALAAAGSPAYLAVGRTGQLISARTASQRRWFDRGWAKFGLFPLLPALVAFRLHQHIAYGGTFGELHTYGPQAWLLGLLIWWVSWALGLMLLAAVLRVWIEVGTALAVALRPSSAIPARCALEWLGRAVFYLGMPAWLLLRLLPG